MEGIGPGVDQLLPHAKNESAGVVAQLVCRKGIKEAGHSRDDDGNDRQQRSAGKSPLPMVHVQDLDVLRWHHGRIPFGH